MKSLKLFLSAVLFLFASYSKADCPCFGPENIKWSKYLGKIQDVPYSLVMSSDGFGHHTALYLVSDTTLPVEFCACFKKVDNEIYYFMSDVKNDVDKLTYTQLLYVGFGDLNRESVEFYMGKLEYEFVFKPAKGEAKHQHNIWTWNGVEYEGQQFHRDNPRTKRINELREAVKQGRSLDSIIVEAQKIELMPDGVNIKFPQKLFIDIFLQTEKEAELAAKNGDVKEAARIIHRLLNQPLLKENRISGSLQKEPADPKQLSLKGYVLEIPGLGHNQYYFLPNESRLTMKLHDCALFLLQAGYAEEAAAILDQIIFHHADRTSALLDCADARWLLYQRSKDKEEKDKAIIHYSAYKKQMQEANQNDVIPKRVFNRI